MTHPDFGGSEAGTAVHPVECDGVKLALVQIHHRQLTGLVNRSCGSAEGKLEVAPGSLRRGAGVGAGVDWAGMVFREGITVGKRLTATQGYALVKGKEEARGETLLSLKLLTVSLPRRWGRGKRCPLATFAATRKSC